MNSKRRCANCKDYFPNETMFRKANPAFCTKDCQDLYVTGLRAKKDQRSAKKEKRKIYRASGPSTELKRQVRKRDENICRRCSTTQWLHVHHINYRSEGGPNVKHNLITLCEDCHDWAHANKRERKPLLLAYIWLLYVEGRKLMLNDVKKVVDERQM